MYKNVFGVFSKLKNRKKNTSGLIKKVSKSEKKKKK
jgi:hypothetical protein